MLETRQHGARVVSQPRQPALTMIINTHVLSTIPNNHSVLPHPNSRVLMRLARRLLQYGGGKATGNPDCIQCKQLHERGHAQLCISWSAACAQLMHPIWIHSAQSSSASRLQLCSGPMQGCFAAVPIRHIGAFSVQCARVIKPSCHLWCAVCWDGLPL
jgi:hypothetical protein